MGLDISIYSDLESIEVPKDIELWSDDYYEWEQTADVPDHKDIVALYQPGGDGWGQDRYGDYPPGVYLAEPIDGFRAGSYSGYGHWRDLLSRVGAGFPGGSHEAWAHDGEGYPFEELINYSDAEGYIAAPITDKLCKDFVEFEKDMDDVVDKAYLKIHPSIELTGEEKDWFLMKWNDWKGAMCAASQNGVVMWH